MTIRERDKPTPLLSLCTAWSWHEQVAGSMQQSEVTKSLVFWLTDQKREPQETLPHPALSQGVATTLPKRKFTRRPL